MTNVICSDIYTLNN